MYLLLRRNNCHRIVPSDHDTKLKDLCNLLDSNADENLSVRLFKWFECRTEVQQCDRWLPLTPTHTHTHTIFLVLQIRFLLDTVDCICMQRNSEFWIFPDGVQIASCWCKY